MKEIIPKELILDYIQDSGWNPENERKNKVYQPIFDLKDFNNRIETNAPCLSASLESALDNIGPKGYIATLPELIQLELNGIINEIGQISHSEENIGIDTKGIHGKKGDIVIAIVHGGGILTPELLKKENELMLRGLSYKQKTFDNLLLGKLETGKQIEVYNIKDILKGTNIPHQCVITLKLNEKYFDYNIETHREIYKNELAIARTGNIYLLQQYNQSKRINGVIPSSLNIYYEDREFSSPKLKTLVLFEDEKGFGNPFFIGRKGPLLYVTKK